METIYQKVKYLILAIGIFGLFYNNIKIDYSILTEKQKPCFPEALSFMNEFIQPQDMIFFPIYMNQPNFLYYAEKLSYKQFLHEALKQSYSPLKISDFFPDRDSIPNYITRFSSDYKRIWIIVVNDKILEREVFNLSYVKVLLNYLSVNYNLILCKKFKYIDIYLFQLS